MRGAGAATRAVAVNAPGDPTHQVQSFMTGEAVRQVFESDGTLPCTTYRYAHNLFSDAFRDAMDGKRTLEDAAANLICVLSRERYLERSFSVRSPEAAGQPLAKRAAGTSPTFRPIDALAPAVRT